MDNDNQKGILGTIIFHGLMFLCVLLMSFASGGGGGGGDNGTGEALGGMEVMLGEPNLGGNDADAGYPEPEQQPIPDETNESETLTEDDADAPEIKSKPKEEIKKAPVITAPVVKETVPSTKPPKPIPRIKFKAGNKGVGTTPGVGGEDDGSINGGANKGDGGDGKPGNGPGNGPGTGPGNGPGTGGGEDGGNTSGIGSIKLDLSGFKRDRDFVIDTDRSGSGTVIIKLCVNKDGSIKSVSNSGKGTLQNKYFIDLAIKAVKENSYSPIKGAMAETTCGFVTFKFSAR